MAELALTGLRRRYPGSDFELRVPDLRVPQGEILCLLGPNGAGKSTLLRLILGLDPRNEGQVTYGGVTVDRRNGRRDIAMVFQKPLLLRGSVGYNLELARRLRPSGASQGDTRDMLERLGIDGLMDTHVSTLSGGQTNLAAIARALVQSPSCLLLDEPTASLDPARTARLEGLLRERCDALSMTVVFSSHDLFQARRLADRVALLLNGEIVEVAPRDQFFRHPQDPRTVAFLRGELVF